MRGQAAGVAKQLEDVAKLPTITTADGTQLIGCTMSKIDNGFAIIRHQDGISKVSLKELDATEKKLSTPLRKVGPLTIPPQVQKIPPGRSRKSCSRMGFS
jgi:hypothetical protein